MTVTQSINNNKKTIVFIDLAGNEQDWNAGVGALNEETLFINKSLSEFLIKMVKLMANGKTGMENFYILHSIKF